MWEYEHSVETTATREALWRHWTDVAGWPAWNAGVESIEIDGPFQAGTTFTMTPPGEDPIAMRLIEVVPSERFTDEMDAGDFVVRTTHLLEPAADSRTRITYRTEIAGPAAGRRGGPGGRLPPVKQIGPELGPAITADFPEVLAALAALAAGAEDHDAS